MVELIVGAKGSGKTKRLVDDLNSKAQDEHNNVICIQKGDRLNSWVQYNIRMVDISDYPVESYGELLAFIAGLNAKDYDISHIYIDSITKIVEDDQEALFKFLVALEGMSEKQNFDAEIMYSCPLEEINDSVRKFVKA